MEGGKEREVEEGKEERRKGREERVCEGGGTEEKRERGKEGRRGSEGGRLEGRKEGQKEEGKRTR